MTSFIRLYVLYGQGRRRVFAGLKFAVQVVAASTGHCKGCACVQDGERPEWRHHGPSAVLPVEVTHLRVGEGTVNRIGANCYQVRA